MKRVADRPFAAVIVIGIVLLTAAGYLRIWNLGFINMDDPGYVSANPHVAAGLGLSGIAWAMTTTEQANWHPLTWISLMLDSSLGGSGPGIYHAINLALHALSAVLLFVALDRMTRARLRSGFVALLFAIHPAHVESVAWISERKDVLSAFFWMLTLIAYARYAESPGMRRYGLVFVSFALGLLAKPMLVTLPLVLLLLDAWPLGRWKSEGARRVLLEKLPFCAASVLSSVVTWTVQRPAMERMESVPLGARVGNALVSYVAYVGKMFWPARLSIFYPYPRHLTWEPFAAALALAGLTAAVMVASRRCPWLSVGWLWYMITLVPVIGFVQVGLQARADRYTYIPFVGLFVMVAWGSSAIAEGLLPVAARRAVLRASALVVAILLLVTTWTQLGYWQDGVTLFTHAIEVTSDNVLAQFNLADAYTSRGDEERALIHLREAVRIDPRFPDSQFNLTSALIRRRELDEAEALSRQARQLWPDDERSVVNPGIIALLRGNYAEAETQLAEALRRYPNSAVARHNLATARAARARGQ